MLYIMFKINVRFDSCDPQYRLNSNHPYPEQWDLYSLFKKIFPHASPTDQGISLKTHHFWENLVQHEKKKCKLKIFIN